jgi:hypothetical protein
MRAQTKKAGISARSYRYRSSPENLAEQLRRQPGLPN